MSQATSRDESLDLVCGILVIHMIWGHIALATDAASPLRMVLSFFMPWFYFKSGMFFKHNADCKATMIKDARHLLRPFWVTALIGQLLQWAWLLVTRDHSLWHYLNPPLYLIYYGTVQGNTPLWFLTSLFLVKAFYNFIYGRVHPWVVILASCAAGFALHLWLPKAPPIISSQCLGLAFYVLGVQWRTLHKNMWAVIASLAIVVLTAVYCPSRVGAYGNELLDGSYLLFIPFAAGCILLGNRLAQPVLIALRTLRLSKPFTALGRHSIFFYTTHWLCIVATRTVMIGLLGCDKHSPIYLLTLVVVVFAGLPILWLAIRQRPCIIKIFGRNA